MIENEHVQVFSIKPTKPGSRSTSKEQNESASSTAQPIPDQKNSKEFRFVNNSPNSMIKPRNRMKPTFRVETPNLSHSSSKSESVIIEQTFSKNSTEDKKYVFQLNMKRPPGRPRKHPVEENKPKRPQGRPRKYPIEVSGSAVLNLSSSKVVKKPQESQIHSSSTSIAQTTESNLTPSQSSTLVGNQEQFPIPIDTELALASAKRGRGRPKRNEKDGKLKEDNTTEVAVAVALNEPESVNE